MPNPSLRPSCNATMASVAAQHSMFHEALLHVMAAPGCHHPLELAEGAVASDGTVTTGELVDRICGRRVAIRSGIPRFVTEGYAASFGEQWNRFSRTQLDRFNGTILSRDRFYSGTGWTPQQLRGCRILEAGCGAGRFTQIMLDAGAEVYAFDLSSAVEACLANNGPHPNLCVFQADLFTPPLQSEAFDKIFCYGVLQHTPDPERAFQSLVPFLKPGGDMAIDIYRKKWECLPSKSKYLYRPLTTRMSRERLFRLIQWYVPKWLPIDTRLRRVPKLGPLLGMLVPCWNYATLPLTATQVVEWGILDTFDALAARYDFPQTLESVRRWFEEAGFVDIRIREGGNGILANGRKPAGKPS